MSYPGAKSGSGVFQAIINQMPPHSVYVEPFLGSGAIMRRKRPALLNLGFDLDEHQVKIASSLAGRGELVTLPRPGRLDGFGDEVPSWRFDCRDGIEYLAERHLTDQALVYCDPPYLLETRRQRRRIYRYELTRAHHVELLGACRRQSANVMVSGYRSELYDVALDGWRRVDFVAQTHRGPALESLWMNYSAPDELHDYRYLGDDYRERERIRRQQRRWIRRLDAMPDDERLAMLAALNQTERPRRRMREGD